MDEKGDRPGTRWGSTEETGAGVRRRGSPCCPAPLSLPFARQFIARFEMPDDAIGPIALMARVKVMVAHDALGRTLDGCDRPELTVPPHHAFRRVRPSRQDASIAPTYD